MKNSDVLQFIYRLESGVKKLEEQVLLQKIIDLELQIRVLENQLSTPIKQKPDNLPEKFVSKILNEYGNLIKSMCTNMESKCPGASMTKKDFEQEGLEYMVKWCLPQSKRLSTTDYTWIPYVKRSLQMCFVNIMKKSSAYDRLPEVLIGDFNIGSDVFESDVDVGADYEYEELVARVLHELTPRDKTILQNILHPPSDLRAFIKLKRGMKKKQSTRRVLADFYGLPLSTINSAFITFKKTIQRCVLQVES